MKHWTILILSGLAEAVWAVALDSGFTQFSHVLAFVVGLAASIAGLEYAMRAIPMGTAYAVWTGIGASATAVWSGIMGEPFTPGKIVSLLVIVGCVVGLQLTTPKKTESSAEAAPGEA